MKIYRERPKTKSNAQLAWDYFTNRSSVQIRELFFSRDCSYGQRWIADFGFQDWGGGYVGDGISNVSSPGGWITLDAETSTILEWAQAQPNKANAADPNSPAFSQESARKEIE